MCGYHSKDQNKINLFISLSSLTELSLWPNLDPEEEARCSQVSRKARAIFGAPASQGTNISHPGWPPILPRVRCWQSTTAIIWRSVTYQRNHPLMPPTSTEQMSGGLKLTGTQTNSHKAAQELDMSGRLKWFTPLCNKWGGVRAWFINTKASACIGKLQSRWVLLTGHRLAILI